MLMSIDETRENSGISYVYGLGLTWYIDFCSASYVSNSFPVNKDDRIARRVSSCAINQSPPLNCDHLISLLDGSDWHLYIVHGALGCGSLIGCVRVR